jgi:hypothetical protein
VPTASRHLARHKRRKAPEPLDFELVAAELIRSLRGRQSQAAFSRRLGYRSNIANRWEAQVAFPTAARFLGFLEVLRPRDSSWLGRFFTRVPSALGSEKPSSPRTVALFLTELRGRTPILAVARESGFNRYSVSRWLEGRAEPRLPQFLKLVHVMSRRLYDFLAVCTNPETMSSVAGAWRRLELARDVAYTVPWSHAVLRALELDAAHAHHQNAFIAEHLGIGVDEVKKALMVLQRTGQVTRIRGKWRLTEVVSVNTAPDRERALGLRVMWTETALERLRRGMPGSYGFSLFAISRADLQRLRDLQLEYVRAMQAVVAASQPGECVGLYCAQLLDLSTRDNALPA